MSQSRLLVISDASVEFSVPPGVDFLRVSYAFSDEQRSDYLSAWWQADGQLAAATASRNLAGGFRQQSLNRLVAQTVLQHPVGAVVLVGLYGCTLDLPRLFNLLQVPVIWLIQTGVPLSQLDVAGAACLADSLRKSHAVCDPAGVLSGDWPCESITVEEIGLRLESLLAKSSTKAAANYDYSLYEFSQRDHPLLCLFQEQDVRHFHGCKRVLDLGSGVGIFLGLLQATGVKGIGVERNPTIADYARGMGLDVRTQDALEFLSTTNERFDGIYCSHFVEHLPIELVEQLLAGLARVLDDHGLAVLAFPDPESIRAQLMGFWRDPEHVRFYHPDLVASLAQAVGLECEWTSYQDQPHEVGFFPLEPPPLRCLPEYEALKPGGLARLWRWLGIATRVELDQQQNLIRAQREVIQQLAERSEQLWAVNRTWGWRDTVVLKLKRRPR